MTERERLLRSEAKRARIAQDMIVANEFIPLAEAARGVKVPLSTLAHAVRTGRVPAVKVQPGRWLVRMDAVRLYLSKDKQSIEERVERELMRRGLIAERKETRPQARRFKPVKVGGRSVLDYLAEGRR